jgi:hypothetical protein
MVLPDNNIKTGPIRQQTTIFRMTIEIRGSLKPSRLMATASEDVRLTTE